MDAERTRDLGIGVPMTQAGKADAFYGFPTQWSCVPIGKQALKVRAEFH